MFRKAMAEVDVKAGIQLIRQRINDACLKRDPELHCTEVALVAVSKTKPVEMILEAYDSGQRHFGENYVKELSEKSQDPRIIEKCKEISWHFIGHLQTNKVNKLMSSPGLHMIQTIDSAKLAVTVNNAVPKFISTDHKLRIMLQVNTSNEEEKNGIEPNEIVEVAKCVIEKCPNLKLDGLMTIGKFGYDLSQGPNPDFLCLKKCRDEVSKALDIKWQDLNLSMGMSDDFEHAIELGSTVVRVGSSIFGYRPKKMTENK